jgi:hypothetical protein
MLLELLPKIPLLSYIMPVAPPGNDIVLIIFIAFEVFYIKLPEMLMALRKNISSY